MLNSLEVYRKVSKWTDDIKKDTRFCGIGTVNNQIHLANGSKLDRPTEDRSFSYELKDNQIFAYGILDGYDGNWTVDLVEQCLLTNVYFDHLQALQKKTDNEIHAILKNEFEKVELTLKDNQQELLMKRSSRTFLNSELRKGTFEYLDNLREIKILDKQIESGSFAMVSLIIDNRLFVANVGTSHCFICVFDKVTNEKKVISLAELEHSITNLKEMIRLSNLKANIQNETEKNNEASSLEPNKFQIKYTRCLGGFKLKLYYHEYPPFRDCTGPPIIHQPDHLDQEIIIDDSFLFMAMYSDGLSKVLSMTDIKPENHCSMIARMLIGKIISEQTLNSAAQSVLDEIKRAFDDKYVNTEYEREDLTLIVRVFDPNIKNRLIYIENYADQMNGMYNGQSQNKQSEEVRFIETSSEILDTLDDTYDSLQTTNESYRTISSSIATSLDQKDHAKRSQKSIDSHLDKDGNVISYINLQDLEDILSIEENKLKVEEFYSQLVALNEEKSSEVTDEPKKNS